MKKRIIYRICLIITIFTVTLCLTACNSNNYKKAEAYFVNGEYMSALQIYAELGTYEDSQEKAALCKYELGNEHFKNEAYEDALNYYVELGAFKDCTEKIQICEREIGMRENADYDFLSKMEESILDRMAKSNAGNVDKNQLVNVELAYIEPFLEKQFYFVELSELAKKYTEGLHIQKEALKQKAYCDYQVQWQRGMVWRYEVLNELYKKYDFLADNAEFVGTYVAQYEDTYNLLKAYEAIEADILAQTTAEGFSWKRKGYYVTCTLTNNTEYTFSTTFQMQYYDKNNTQFATGSAYIQNIAPGESYVVNCYASNPSQIAYYEWTNSYDEVFF